MQLFIKILAISFPFVFALVLFWPAAKGGDLPASQSAGDRRPVVVTNSEIPPGVPGGLVEGSSELQAAIYKWTDAEGTIHFSDRPDGRDAVAHAPEKIGHYAVSADIKQRITDDRRNQAKLRLQESVRKKSEKPAAPQPADYKFSLTSAGQKHGYVLLTGRISGGPACTQLRVFAQARSDEGRVVSGQQDIEFSGFGSELFEMKPRSGWDGRGRNRPQWEIVRVSARCVAR